MAPLVRMRIVSPIRSHFLVSSAASRRCEAGRKIVGRAQVDFRDVALEHALVDDKMFERRRAVSPSRSSGSSTTTSSSSRRFQRRSETRCMARTRAPRRGDWRSHRRVRRRVTGAESPTKSGRCGIVGSLRLGDGGAGTFHDEEPVRGLPQREGQLLDEGNGDGVGILAAHFRIRDPGQSHQTLAGGEDVGTEDRLARLEAQRSRECPTAWCGRCPADARRRCRSRHRRSFRRRRGRPP